jgi:predicted ATPase
VPISGIARLMAEAAAAVAGRRMDDELVRLASGLVAGDYEEAVRESVASQLLIPDGDAGYAFRHALIREAIYADLLPGERTRMHARLAELLSDEARLAAEPGTAADLAHLRPGPGPRARSRGCGRAGTRRAPRPPATSTRTGA